MAKNATKTTAPKAETKPTEELKAVQDPATAEPEAPAKVDEAILTDEEKIKALSLDEKLLLITAEVGKIEKTGRNSLQNYSFIEQAAVITELRGKLVHYGVQITPEMIEHVMHKKDKGAKILVKFKMHVKNVHKPDDKQEIQWYGEGDDSLDKGTNKAATAAEKYFLMKLFKISDRDDPDADSPGMKARANNYQSNNGPAVQKPAAPPARAANSPIDDQERQQLAKAMVRLGFDDKKQQLDLLKANGISDPSKLTSGMARSMINKLSSNAFELPVVDVAEDVHEDPEMNIPDGPLPTPDFGPEAAPQAPAPAAKKEMPPLQVDDDLKGYVEENYNNMGLNQLGKMWFLKEVAGKPFAKFETFTEQNWRDAFDFVQGILELDIDVDEKHIAGLVRDENENPEKPAATVDPSVPKKDQVVVEPIEEAA